MTKKRKLTEPEREKLVHEWTRTPAINPRYRGATPAEVARSLLRPVKKTKK